MKIINNKNECRLEIDGEAGLLLSRNTEYALYVDQNVSNVKVMNFKIIGISSEYRIIRFLKSLKAVWEFCK